jgi:DNA-binding Lrp family transcriptional regulator
MAIGAYIFVETDHGKARTVNQEILKLPFVKRSHIVTGPYDLVCYVEAPDITTLGESVVMKIQCCGGVIKSLTNIVVD